MRLLKVIVAVLGLLLPVRYALAAADASLAYEVIQPARIQLGESATIQVVSFSGYLPNIQIPNVRGLKFEVLGRAQGFDMAQGTAIPATFLQIRVTAQFVGDFTIPALFPNAKPLGLEVVEGIGPGPGPGPDPFAFPSQMPAPLPVAPVALPKGVQLKAGDAAFVQLLMPTRPVYVGESVPVEIALGIRPGIVTSVNGLPTLNNSDFTLEDLSPHPKDREQLVGDRSFRVLTWNSVVAAIKPGAYSLTVDAPISARILSRKDRAYASALQWPFLQIMTNGITPKDLTITSPAAKLEVLPLPTEGQPRDFSGAVGTFEVSSDVSARQVAVGDPLTVRLHIRGVGNFDRVNAAMFDHLEHWRTYPAKSSFTHSDEVGYRGEKVFEQPLIASRPGEQVIPSLEFSYFDPTTRHYERAHTFPITVVVASALTRALGGEFARGLRPDHQPHARGAASQLRPLFFQAQFLTAAALLALALAVAASWPALRPSRRRATSAATERALAELAAAARAGDSPRFFDLARRTLVGTLADRWQIPAGQMTSAELRARLGAANEDIDRLFRLADEARYSREAPAGADFQYWLRFIRRQLAGGSE